MMIETKGRGVREDSRITFRSLLCVTCLLAGMPAVHGQGFMPKAETNECFTMHLDFPEGSRIEYLRLYYYDTGAADSLAWLSTYDGSGGLDDLTAVSSAGDSGYGSRLSDLIDHVVDNETNAYVLNWRSGAFGPDQRLCGLRVAYRVPVDVGWSGFRYVFAAGAAMRPRDSATAWVYEGGGCISALDPVVFADAFESGGTKRR